jgi:hypothetical protein
VLLSQRLDEHGEEHERSHDSRDQPDDRASPTKLLRVLLQVPHGDDPEQERQRRGYDDERKEPRVRSTTFSSEGTFREAKAGSTPRHCRY